MTHVMKNTGRPDGMSTTEIEENAQVFIIAGAETTASYLTGLLFHLLCNRSKLDILVKEIRSAFSQEDDISIAATTGLKYLGAVIQEGMRIFPPGKSSSPFTYYHPLTHVPAPQGVQRVTPRSGAMIAGKHVAGSTFVGINRK